MRAFNSWNQNAFGVARTQKICQSEWNTFNYFQILNPFIVKQNKPIHWEVQELSTVIVILRSEWPNLASLSVIWFDSMFKYLTISNCN